MELHIIKITVFLLSTTNNIWLHNTFLCILISAVFDVTMSTTVVCYALVP